MVSVLQPPLPSQQHRASFWDGLAGSSMALAIANVAATHTAPLLLVAPNSLSAMQMEDALRFFYRDHQQAPSIIHFPDWETLPYDQFSPHQDIISQRLRALHDIPLLKRGIVITTISTLMQRLPAHAYIEGNSFVFKCGDKLDHERFRERLTRNNYIHVSKVMEHGEFSIRGSIIDVYPMGSELPFRIDLFDNEIDTIKVFDPDTQLSSEPCNEINLLPAREFPLSDHAITHFRQHWRARFSGNPVNCPVYEDISNAIAPAGIEYYLPLFFDAMSHLFDYLPTDALIVKLPSIQQRAHEFWQEVKHRHEQLNYDVTRPILPPAEVFLPADDVFAAMNHFSQIVIGEEKQLEVFNCRAIIDVRVDAKHSAPLQNLQTFIGSHQQRILFCAESAGRREALLELFADSGIKPEVCASWQAFLASDSRLAITQGLLGQGFITDDPAVAIITEAELFEQHIMQRRRRKARKQDGELIVRDLAELHIGAPVVHLQHGVGRYMGLKTLKTGGISAEFLTLEYSGGDKIYVPITSLDLISRYSGMDVETAPINKLGNDKWAKEKRKAMEKISDVAAELLDIYALREAKKGHAFKDPGSSYHNFVAAFPFEPTPDQEDAFAAVFTDMTTDKSMDRLICGDVGFGKTEVAMRAAFIAAFNGKQVAVLVPTTLLASQHYENFKDRFADFPVNIDLLSRFRSKKEQDITLANIAAGKVDIVIGTHKLIQKDMEFHDLGLIIIDEEHRFGVKQKEVLKKFRAEIDILNLTATPIPRTLNMSMSGMRDISIIATPPAKRLSIKTFMHKHQPQIVREAILREILRGGQVFFLHNNVETIQRIAHDVAKLVPEAKVEIAHGQMRERELESVMSDFYHRRFNVLICTTIIETGIDIPTANTIIIDRADKFGLAQLHQLRGRVGRSHHQAYAYLLVPDKKAMTSDANKRLEAFLSLEDLGAGFSLATHDMEIRGAGELLGDEQSGHMQAIGFTLYMDLLDRAVKALKAGQKIELEKPFELGTDINLHINALIPDDYIPDIQTRLNLYKRISSAADKNALKELQVEMIDRFGLLPIAVKNLFRVSELKLKAQPFGIDKIEANGRGGKLFFNEKPNIDPAKIITLIQVYPNKYQLDGADKFKFIIPSEDAEQRINAVNEVLNQLG